MYIKEKFKKENNNKNAESAEINCSTTGKPTRSFATERVSLDSV